MIFYTLILAIIVLKIILVFFLGTVPTTIDKSVSDATKLSNQISMKKNIVLPKKYIETTIIASRFDDENGQVSTSTHAHLAAIRLL